MKRNLNVLLAIINAYKGEDGYSHFSSVEITRKFGIAQKNIPTMLKELVELKCIENYTTNGFYNRYKILTHLECPDFILDEKLNNSQKSFLLRCVEQNITEDLSKKEICRRVNNNENCSNLNKSISGILESCSIESIFDIIKNYKVVTNLIPECAVKSDYGYRTDSPIAKEYGLTGIDKIAHYLICKSTNSKRSRNRSLEYTLTIEYIKEILLKQDYKDYYTGLPVENYEDYSIDRIDSNLGYIEGNIVITTTRVNVAKNDMSMEEFKKLISNLYNNISNF